MEKREERSYIKRGQGIFFTANFEAKSKSSPFSLMKIEKKNGDQMWNLYSLDAKMIFDYHLANVPQPQTHRQQHMLYITVTNNDKMKLL